MRIGEGNRIVAMACVPHDDDEETTHIEDDGSENPDEGAELPETEATAEETVQETPAE